MKSRKEDYEGRLQRRLLEFAGLRAPGSPGWADAQIPMKELELKVMGLRGEIAECERIIGSWHRAHTRLIQGVQNVITEAEETWVSQQHILVRLKALLPEAPDEQ